MEPESFNQLSDNAKTCVNALKANPLRKMTNLDLINLFQSIDRWEWCRVLRELYSVAHEEGSVGGTGDLLRVSHGVWSYDPVF